MAACARLGGLTPDHAQGTDISAAMLDVALDREVEGDLCLHDLGAGLPLRAGTFDGAISISAVQWLCNAVRAQLLKPFDGFRIVAEPDQEAAVVVIGP